jgi:hypothetical protein
MYRSRCYVEGPEADRADQKPPDERSMALKRKRRR